MFIKRSEWVPNDNVYSANAEAESMACVRMSANVTLLSFSIFNVFLRSDQYTQAPTPTTILQFSNM